jgi:hypothetical protein
MPLGMPPFEVWVHLRPEDLLPGEQLPAVHGVRDEDSSQ